MIFKSRRLRLERQQMKVFQGLDGSRSLRRLRGGRVKPGPEELNGVGLCS